MRKNGHWKPELLRGRDFQQLWFLAGEEAETLKIRQDGRNPIEPLQSRIREQGVGHTVELGKARMPNLENSF